MNHRRLFPPFLIAAFALAGSASPAIAAAGLEVQFGATGISSLTYNGAVLFDENVSPADKARIVDYTLVTGNKSVHVQDDIHFTTSWNPQTRTLTQALAWGTVATRYDVQPNGVEMTVAVTNSTPHSTLNGISIFPLELRFPNVPKPFASGTHVGTTDPGVLIADYGTGAAAYVQEDVNRPLYYGFVNDNNTAKFNNFTAWIGISRLPWGATPPDCLAPIRPNSTATFHVSLRFGPSGSTPATIAPDVLSAYAAAFPFNINWPDHRPIGMIMIAANGPRSNSPTNPPGWLNNPKLNVLNDTGRADFAKQLVIYAEHCVSNLRAMNAQGMITWDLEGEQYATSYIGDPRIATQLSPELNYNGAIDKYFKMFRLAGLKVGVTIRPQKLIFKDGVPIAQEDPTNPDAEVQLYCDKIEYAQEHWGCSIFYIDSTGGTENPSILTRVHQRFPEVLLIPENSNTGMYSVCAPFAAIRANRGETPAVVRQVYPDAFSVIDTTVEKPLAWEAELIDGVRHGDILMFPAGGLSNFVQRIYREAGK